MITIMAEMNDANDDEGSVPEFLTAVRTETKKQKMISSGCEENAC